MGSVVQNISDHIFGSALFVVLLEIDVSSPQEFACMPCRITLATRHGLVAELIIIYVRSHRWNRSYFVLLDPMHFELMHFDLACFKNRLYVSIVF